MSKEINKKGISLVALVITIIVLIILTGTVILSMIGDNNIFNRGQDATSTYHNQSDQDIITSNVLAYELLKYQGTETTLIEFIQSQDWCSNAVYNESLNKITITLKNCGHIYEVSDDGNITALGGLENGNTAKVNSMDAFEYFLQDEAVKVINIEDNFAVNKQFAIEGKELTINGNGHKITYDSSYTGSLFNVSSNASLSIDNLLIDGGNNWTEKEEWSNSTDVWYEEYITSSGIDVTTPIINNEGNLTLGSNVNISNVILNANSGAYNSDLAVIKSTGGNLILDGVNITHCAGMALNASDTNVTIKGNTNISNNYCTANKGGVIILSNSPTTMSGNVKINNNKAVVRSGLVIGLISGTNFIMNGGEISGNETLSYGSNTIGATIVAESGAGMTMNGGSITNNVGVLAGAIATRWQNADNIGITLNGGTIANNTTMRDSWSGPEIYLRSSCEIGPNMTINGLVTVNGETNIPCILNHMGTIKGKLILNSSIATVLSTGNVLREENSTDTDDIIQVTDGSLVITGGTYAMDVTSWVANTHQVQSSEGLYTVVEK